MLSAHIPDARVLDLFAGTGALGIEALSRGAAHATFVEKDRAVMALLRDNLAAVAESDTLLLQIPAARAIKELAGGTPYDLVFMDPPYAEALLTPSLEAVVQSGLLAADAVVVCEHAGRDAAPPAPTGWCCNETRKFGDVALSFFRAAQGESK